MTFSRFRYKWMGQAVATGVAIGLCFWLAKAGLAMLGVG